MSTPTLSPRTAARIEAADFVATDELRPGDRIAIIRNHRVGFYRIKRIPARQTDPRWFEVKLAAWPAAELLTLGGLYHTERS